MKTVIQENQLALFAGTSIAEAEGASFEAMFYRANLTTLISNFLLKHQTYAGGAVRSSVEVRIAYAQLIELTESKTEVELVRTRVGICKGTHYRWIKDAKGVAEGTLEVRTIVKRKA